MNTCTSSIPTPPSPLFEASFVGQIFWLFCRYSVAEQKLNIWKNCSFTEIVLEVCGLSNLYMDISIIAKILLDDSDTLVHIAGWSNE